MAAGGDQVSERVQVFNTHDGATFWSLRYDLSDLGDQYLVWAVAQLIGRGQKPPREALERARVVVAFSTNHLLPSMLPDVR